MKSYIRESCKPRSAYHYEIAEAVNDGFGAGVAVALYSLSLNNGFGKKRLTDLFETCKNIVSKDKGRRSNLQDVKDLLRNKYGIDVTALDLEVIVKTH